MKDYATTWNIIIGITIALCFLGSLGIGMAASTLSFGFGIAVFAFCGLVGVFITLGVYSFLKDIF